MNQSRNRSTEPVESCVTSTLTDMLGHEPVGLLAAGIDPSGLLLGLLGPATGTDAGTEEFFTADPFSLFPEAAKRKVVEDEDEDDDDDEEEDEDDVADEEEDEEEDEEVEEDEDVDEDEEEEDEDDDEEEEEDEFDDPDDDDDYDDDDDDEDFDDDE